MLDTYEQHSKRKLMATILAVIVIAGAVVLVDHFKSSTSSSAATVAATSAPAASGTSTTPASSSTAATTDSSAATDTSTTSQGSNSYKDGTYTATSSYYVPHGSETIAVSLTISGGVVTGSTIQNSESDHDSARYQEDFAAVYKSYVVGKKISGLQLGNISGASDTTEGFNDALSQIASKAQA